MTRPIRSFVLTVLGVAAALGICLSPSLAQSTSILKQLKNISVISTTVPSNGDVNPYGLVRVPVSSGKLIEGNYLVSNFNNSSNAQGTGTTIVQISPGGTLSLFAELNASTLPGPCPGGVGLTTALAVLQTGWVIVGSLPTSDGTSATAQAGCLIVLNSRGQAVETIYGSLINGPWDLTWTDDATDAVLFVTNVLNGTVAANGAIVRTATVVRVHLTISGSRMPDLESITVIGDGFSARTDPNALVIGPTGLSLSTGDDPVLYVADTLHNRIAVITNPFARYTASNNGDSTLASGGTVGGPLGLTVAPNGNIIAVNSINGWATEITPAGQQIATTQLDNTGGPPPGAGALFGVLYDPEVGLIYVDDNSNTLNKLAQ
jgi:hypothetical protein